jgi:crossover junction endodeoxyribonuclease RuvC
VVLLAPGLAGIPVFEYAPNQVKKAVVGNGHAAKEQIHVMVRHLLPGVALNGPDAADALAVAICHAHQASVTRRWARAPAAAG